MVGFGFLKQLVTIGFQPIFRRKKETISLKENILHLVILFREMSPAAMPNLHAMKVGRVIARPFAGTVQDFHRTGNRHDYAMDPPAPTLLDWVAGAGRATHAIGKIGDIFSMRGIGALYKGDDAALFDHLDRLGAEAEDGSLTFANFVEFDSLYGHPRDVAGYARALEWFDARAGAFLAKMRAGDMAIFTADHGNDPTWRGTEHTRERVPVLVAGQGTGKIGLCAFTDVAAVVAHHLGVLPPDPRGISLSMKG